MASSAVAAAMVDDGQETAVSTDKVGGTVRSVEALERVEALSTEEARSLRREVHATGHEWEWQLAGACRSIDAAEAELFFHPWGERDPSRGRRDRAAKAICARCPVLLQCREYALATREPYGVWGGLSEHDREEILGVRFG